MFRALEEKCCPRSVVYYCLFSDKTLHYLNKFNADSVFSVIGDHAGHPLAALQAAAAAAGISPQQCPFLFNPALMPLVQGLGIKTESPTTQSRGCSPIIFEEETGKKKRAPRRKKVSTAVACVQTDTDLDPERQPLPLTRKQSVCAELGVQASLIDPHLQPLSVICGSEFKSSAPLGALAAAALAAEGNVVTFTPDVKVGSSSREAGVTYNPFTDPQILQAADGLELLSTLAEKRPKCASAPLVSSVAVHIHCLL
jgi:hypothetical protein